jgi:hypothetical protein
MVAKRHSGPSRVAEGKKEWRSMTIKAKMRVPPSAH